MIQIGCKRDRKRYAHSSLASKVLGSLGEAPFRSVVNVNLDATLPSCRVLKVRCSSNRSVSEPSTVRHKLSSVRGQSNLWALIIVQGLWQNICVLLLLIYLFWDPDDFSHSKPTSLLWSTVCSKLDCFQVSFGLEIFYSTGSRNFFPAFA